jgi:hypothetical protein
LRNRFSFLAILVSLTLLTSVANAAVKAGATCSKLGATSTSGGKKYTCVKSGKKLVWNKGVTVMPKPTAIPTPTASPTPAPSPIPTNSVTPKPELPLEHKAPTSFSDLLENYKGIAASVWNEAQQMVAKGSVKTSFSITVGPTTKLQNGLDDPEILLARASKLWSAYAQSSETKIFAFSYPDLSWAQQKLRDLGGSWFTPEDLAGNCSSPISCGAFGGSYKGVGQLFIGVPIREYTPFNLGYVRGNYGHEFTHSVQYAQFASQPLVNGYSILPCWFSEGQPQMPGATLGFQTLIDYKNQRISWFNQPAGAVGDYTPESILKFYTLTGPSKAGQCSPTVRSRVYDIGYMTVEALASIKGIGSTMDVVVGVAGGLTFEDSFKKVYGISWAEAAPILAKVVSTEFMNPLSN